jgi:RecA-family ATPase
MKYSELNPELAAALRTAKGDQKPAPRPNGAEVIAFDGVTSRPRLPFIDMSRWDSEPSPPREWAVDDRIPLKQPYLFTGNGSVGKSLVELARAVAHVLGKPWLGMPVAQGPAIYMGCEDDEDELHRRVADILDYYGATFADAIAGGLHLLSYVREECTLGSPDKGGLIRPTPLYLRLEEAVLDIQPVAVSIDTVADVYAGDEINRQQVTQFIRMLQQTAVRAKCSRQPPALVFAS